MFAMRRFLVFLLFLFTFSVLYAEKEVCWTKHDVKIVWASSNSKGEKIYYQNIYVYNKNDHPVLVTIELRRCREHLFSYKKLSSSWRSEIITVTKWIAPKAWKSEFFTQQEIYDLPPLKRVGNLRWGFDILDFDVEILY